VAAVHAQVRRRVLRWFLQRGSLEKAERRQMQRWDHSGDFSVDAIVRIEGWDRDRLERPFPTVPDPRSPRGGWSRPALIGWSTTRLSQAPMGAPS